jgi:hypothetical protein
MAVKADLLAELKRKLNILNANFDTDLNSDLDFAVKDLYPIVLKDVPVAQANVDANGRDITLPAGIDIIQAVEVNGYDVDIKRKHNGILQLRELVNGGDLADIYGFTRILTTDYASIPLEAETAVILFAMSKFYASLAGNRRKYNSYMGSQGAAADRDMKDSVDYFHQLGKEHLEEHFAVRGI